MKINGWKLSADYRIVLMVCLSFIALAFALDTPAQILQGYWEINVSRSVLVTDYIVLGGIGAALLNAALSGLFFLLLLTRSRRAPDGRIIASLWTAIGFSLFGKNFFNMLPILAGVLLYAKMMRVQFSDLFVQAMLSATIAPLVSEIAFLNEQFSALRLLAACGVGLFAGFIFPVVMGAARRMHKGYCLYNSGAAGGFIATLAVGLLRSVGIEILPESIWDTSYTQLLATFVYVLCGALVAYGFIADGPKNALHKFLQLQNEHRRNDNDYLTKYGATCYINIGLMGAFVTSAMLLLKVPINGPVLGGIFTVAGFSASGKHLKSCVPILLGSILATHLNHLEQATPVNALAMLFSTGLAPIAGKYGFIGGLAAGFLHVSVAIFIGQLNGGLNLYNNGFAGSFLAITIVPLMAFFKQTSGIYFKMHSERYRGAFRKIRALLGRFSD